MAQLFLSHSNVCLLVQSYIRPEGVLIQKISTQQSSTYWYREFFIFLVVLEPVSKKIGTGKKSWNRYRKKLVPKKVSEPVSKKFGTGNFEGISGRQQK